MNYKHAYHAGNHTEVFKHSILVLLLQHLRRKPKPFMVLDTHAGVGIYDLTGAEAKKTREAEEGIASVFGKHLHIAAPYLEIVRSQNIGTLQLYPGSPVIVQSLLRDQDRLIACELHEHRFTDLRATFKRDHRVSVHCRNGYEAMRALLPPHERRGLVFIDPPYEEPNELEQLGEAISTALRKWPAAIIAAWYPIKSKPAAQNLKKKLSSERLAKCLSVEFLRFSEDGVRLAGSGMIICNPPWKLDETLKLLCDELLQAFDATNGQWSIDWIVRES